MTLDRPLPPLIHADTRLLVVDKPSGLLSQPGRGPELADSLLTRIRRHWPRAELAHRLDRDTSGLLLVALDADMHRALSRLFAERRIDKSYVADVAGRPARSAGSIELPLAKLGDRPPRYGVDPHGKASRTDWRLLEIHEGWSRLVLHPLSGRSHQLRVHLAASGHPILGDPLYGATGHSSTDRLRLHASELRLVHPHSGEQLIFQAPCPF
jgi:tRNA pseudouridine32 synthase/23S rRNA pseudouridine746 synthase